MPDCYQFASIPDWPTLFSAAPQTVSHDWSGTPIAFRCAFFFAATAERIYFGAEAACAPESAPGSAKDKYFEPLWNNDVVELFVADDTGPQYQEFNLAPNGAWWSMKFDRYRQRSAGFSIPKQVEVFSETQAGSFRAALSIPRSELQVKTSLLESSRANLCAILGREDRAYLAIHTDSASPPDFHRADCFQAIRKRTA